MTNVTFLTCKNSFFYLKLTKTCGGFVKYWNFLIIPADKLIEPLVDNDNDGLTANTACWW